MVPRPKLLQSNLSEAQARTILHTLRFPGFENHQESLGASLPAPTLANLSKLHMHFLLTFPFEALSMNYEPSGRMDATLDHVYSRYVEQRYGGGYCMQTNLLYREMLSLLGYRILGVLGRVYSPVSHDWTGFTHTSTLVYLDSHVQGEEGKKVYYVSDVGYGSSPHRPLLLRDGWEEFGRGSEKYRLIKTEFQPRSTLEEAEDGRESEVDEEVGAVARKQRVWLLQSRKKDKDWENCYTFSPFECFYNDYQASNAATSQAGSVPFGVMILAVRYLLNPTLLPSSPALIARDGLHPDLYPYHPSVVEQRMIVADKHIVKLGDQQIVNRSLDSEEQRVEILKRDFGLLKHVDLHEAVKQISNKPSALKTKAEQS